MTALTLDPGFTTPAVVAVLAPGQRVAAMCAFEAALAASSAVAGIVPAAAAEAVVAACAGPVPDPDGLLVRGWEVGTPVVPLLDVLRGRLPEDAAGWLHHGATTQDVVDSAQMVLARAALEEIEPDLLRCVRALRDVALAHRDTTIAGATFLQPAAETTLGRRVAGWLHPLVEVAGRLPVARGELPVQLGGPTGTLEVFGAAGEAVVTGLAQRLGLAVPPLPWHTDRTPVVRLCQLLGDISRACAKVAGDLVLMASRGEAVMRAGASSSMPGKRNPIDAVRALAAAEVCGAATSVVLRGEPHELERGVGGWHAEWAAVPLALATCAAAVEAVAAATGSLEVTVTSLEGSVPSAGRQVDEVVAACDRVLNTPSGQLGQLQ